MKFNKVVIGVTILALLAPFFSANAEEALFQHEAKKNIERLMLVEDSGYAVVISGGDLAAYKVEDGNKTLSVEDKIASDLFTALCGGTYLVVPLDKGRELAGFDISTGNELWRGATPTKLKRNDLNGVYDTPAGLLLHVRNELIAIDPANGNVLWQKDGLNLAPAELRDAVYAETGDFGNRLVGLGAPMTKVIHVLDGQNGEVLNTLPYDLWMARKPVIRISPGRVAVKHSKGLVGIDLASGDEVWNIEAELSGSDIFEKFEINGVQYALFGFTDSMVIVNLANGEIVFEGGEDIDMRLIEVKQMDDILVLVGLRDQAKARDGEIASNGGFLLTYGVDPAAGKLVWGPTVLAASAVVSLAETSESLGKLGGMMQMARGDVASGMGQMKAAEKALPTRYVGWTGPWEHNGGLLYYVWAEDARVIGELGEEWAEGDGEGLILLDPKTGEVKWRTALTLFDDWSKPLKKILDIKSWNKVEAMTLREQELAPQPILTNDAAFIPAGKKVAKVDLANGEVLWNGPEMDYVTPVGLSGQNLVCEIGGGKFDWKLDKTKNELVDGSGETKDNGILILNADNGSVVTLQETKHTIGTFLSFVDSKTNKAFFSNGEDLWGWSTDSGKQLFELPLKKVTGGLDFKSAMIIDREVGWIDYDPIALGFAHASAQETEIITGSQGLFIRKCKDGSMIVFGPKGPAKIDQDGKTVWTAKWKWDREKVQFAPMLTPRGILYQVDDKLGLISLDDGSILQEVKTDGQVVLSKDGHTAFVLDKKELAAYRL